MRLFSELHHSVFCTPDTYLLLPFRHQNPSSHAVVYLESISSTSCTSLYGSPLACTNAAVHSSRASSLRLATYRPTTTGSSDKSLTLSLLVSLLTTGLRSSLGSRLGERERRRDWTGEWRGGVSRRWRGGVGERWRGGVGERRRCCWGGGPRPAAAKCDPQ